MVFSSSLFILYFLPFFLICYHLWKNIRYRNAVILIFSLFFYSWGAPSFIFILLSFTVFDFYIVQTMHKATSQKAKKRLLTLSICTNLGLLAYFKYANFFIENFNELLLSVGIQQVAWTKIALPIGISFFIFQALTYSIDVYRKIHAPVKSVFDYLVFVTSFPQMVAGPIVRFTAVADQLTQREETVDDKLIGIYRFCIGLAKKVLIANVMAAQADAIFDGDLPNLNAANAWLGMLAYTFQIYFDFSGYSDMAIGLAQIIGFRFPENFNAPYISKNISEFWRRWHMTLGDFMRDYLYIPLGGNRVKSKSRLYFNLWIVFLLSGLWHGASWNFVIWGAYHGLFLILDRMFLVKLLNRLGTFFSILITFLIVMFGWVVFRLEKWHAILLYFQALFRFQTEKIELQPDFIFIACLATFFAFFTAFPIGKKVQHFFYEKTTYSIQQNVALFLLSVILLTFSISFITSSGFNPFIYFRF